MVKLIPKNPKDIELMEQIVRQCNKLSNGDEIALLIDSHREKIKKAIVNGTTFTPPTIN